MVTQNKESLEWKKLPLRVLDKQKWELSGALEHLLEARREGMSPLHGVIRRDFLKEVILKPRPKGDEPIR